jgi:DNA-3-methyladenine glycosylase
MNTGSHKSFSKKVLDVVAAITKGDVLTYKEVAGLAGSPRAFRAVGNILNKNRDPKVPCHRVIRSDGQIGGFAWGSAKKTEILIKEGAIRPASRLQKSGQLQVSTSKVGPTSNIETPGTILNTSFFRRPTLKVAENLLGKYLVRRISKKTIALPITEVEAYDGPNDKACHASKGRTTRTEPMFASGGIFYVYLCYGMHWMLNIVTGPEDYPAAILVRAAGPYNGPAKLTKFLKIDKSLNGREATPENGLWIEDRGFHPSRKKIKRSPRIGVDYAGPVWSKKKYRFTLSV